MTALRRWLLALGFTVVIVIIGCQWLDRPTAVWVHSHLALQRRQILEPVTHIPDPLLPAAAIVFFALGLRVLAGRPLSPFAAVAVACSVSVTMGEVTKDLLKWVFGRTWPETWIHNNPSLIRDGVYGFNWFHGGAGYPSFPSGHMVAASAVISVLWVCYPRLKLFYALVVVAIAAALVAANFHFFSDVVASAFVGASTGWMTTLFFEQQRHVTNGG